MTRDRTSVFIYLDDKITIWTQFFDKNIAPSTSTKFEDLFFSTWKALDKIIEKKSGKDENFFLPVKITYFQL
jgi:hypothetical protein